MVPRPVGRGRHSELLETCPDETELNNTWRRIARMSASKSVPNRTNKRRKPYKPAAITKLTPEAVKTILESKSIQGDEQAERLLEAIRTRLEKQ